MESNTYDDIDDWFKKPYSVPHIIDQCRIMYTMIQLIESARPTFKYKMVQMLLQHNVSIIMRRYVIKNVEPVENVENIEHGTTSLVLLAAKPDGRKMKKRDLLPLYWKLLNGSEQTQDKVPIPTGHMLLRVR